MGLDIRWPIGLMFSLIGAMLVVYGAVTSSNSEIYKHSLNMNVNLCWGVFLLLFGLIMVALAWRDGKRAGPAESVKKPEQTGGRK